MPKRSVTKCKKRNVLGELKDGSEHDSTSNTDAEDQTEDTQEKEIENTPETIDKRPKLTFQLNEGGEEHEEDVDDPQPQTSTGDPNFTDFKVPPVPPPKPEPKKQCARWSELKKMPFNLRCEWKDCDYSSSSVDDFVAHVGDHIPNMDIRYTEDFQDAVYVCSWADCEIELEDTKEAVRHVFYHAFHTKLKAIGQRTMDDKNHPKCLFDSDNKNLIMDIPTPFSCFWEKCTAVFQSAQRFYFHVQAHAVCFIGNTTLRNTILVNCQWRGCRTRARGLQRLITHVRTHTKEKMIACPVCGTTFASKTKFYDHCSRQQSKHGNQYQCSHCARSYPSERVLRDHMRNHINGYKCPFCDMTSPTPSSLSLHIRNRHITDRPFKCEYCNYRGKTQHNLLIHMSTHYSQALYRCEVEDCDFSCRTVNTLNRHSRRVHKTGPECVYCCHICDQRYLAGQRLSKHLIRKHNFRLPSGHSRFRYKCDSEGLYRLETVRYESLEVTQEMIQEVEQPAEQGTVLYVTQTASETNIAPIVTSTPLFIAYDTLDTDGNIVSQLVGVSEPVAVQPAPEEPQPPMLVLIDARDPEEREADQAAV